MDFNENDTNKDVRDTIDPWLPKLTMHYQIAYSLSTSMSV